MKMNFELSQPFLPFEQLMAVLPAASLKLIPPALQTLMTSPDSPIHDFYPVEFEQDLNGKQQDWEAVVLIPFIDENRLLEAMTPRYARFTADEKARNAHGPMFVCTYTPEDLGRTAAPAYFPAIEHNHCFSEAVLREAWDVPRHKLKKGLMEGVKLGTFFPGFPTLQHIGHTARLKKAQVRVFEQASRGENMILTLENQGRPDIADVAKAMIGKEVWVNWPHLIEAKVTGVSNRELRFNQPDQREAPLADFQMQATELRNRFTARYGIEIGESEILVHACPMSGRKYEVGGGRGGGARITLEKQWHKTEQLYPLQSVVADIPVHDASFKQNCTVDELFAPDTACFMLAAEPCFGALGRVVKIDPEHKGRIQLKFLVTDEPDLAPVFKKQGEVHNTFENSYRAAKYLGISSHVMARSIRFLIPTCFYIVVKKSY